MDNINATGTATPGEARCPDAPSTREIIARDGVPVADFLVADHSAFLGDEDIAYDRYTSRDHFQGEIDRLWTQVWQWACREEQIPEPGDYVVYDIGKRSFLIVRGDDGSIKAYYNACMHRGTKLRPSGTEGSTAQFRCPFHGWTWSVNGDLESLPCAWDFPHATAQTHRLAEVRAERWGGFVFINMSDDAPPLREYMEVMPSHLDHWKLEDRYIALNVARELSCNWKAGIEAFLEAYHVLETHPQLLGATSDANSQYDVFGPHVSRRIAAAGSPSPHLDRTMSEQEILDFMAKDGRTRTDQSDVVNEGETARIVLARRQRNAIEERYGVDLSAYTDGEIIDTVEYHLFPNMLVFPNFGLSMVYRFRPLGDEHERCLFEILFLRPVTPGKPRPEPAEQVYLKESQSYREASAMDGGMADIFDQDVSNLAAQQEGFHASGKPGQTLGNYQESRARNFERTVDLFLGRLSQA